MMEDSRELVGRLPYPVAQPAAVALGLVTEASWQTRVWDLVFTGYQALRMATLPVVAEYLDAPIATADMPSQRAVGRIAVALARLRGPYYSDWIWLLGSLAKHMTAEKVGVEPGLPLAEAKAALEARPYPAMGPEYRAADGRDPAPSQ